MTQSARISWKHLAKQNFSLERLWEWSPILLILPFLIAWWYSTVIQLAVPIWAPSTDSPIMSLAQGVNIDYWLFGHHGGRAIGQPQYYQPGFPYQILSWIAYRLASPTLFLAPDQLFDHLAKDPSRFWAIVQIYPLLLSSAALILIWKSSFKERFSVVLAALSSYFICASALQYGVDDFFNESFSLLLGAIFFLQARSVFDEKTQEKFRPVAVSGLLAGLLYLHKMNYVVWGMALIPALIAAGLVGRFHWRTVALQIGVFIVCLLGSLNAVGRAFLGTHGFRLMLQGHLGIFWGSGAYGSGQQTIVTANTLKTSWQALLGSEGPMLALLLASVTTTAILVVIHRRDRAWLRKYLPEGILLAAAASAMFLALLKHYQPHYTVAVAAVFPFLILWAARVGTPHLLFWALLPGIAFGVNHNITGRLHARQIYLQHYSQILQDEHDILRTQLSPREIRLWFYRVTAPVGQRGFLVSFSSIPQLQDRITTLQRNEIFASPWFDSIYYPDHFSRITDSPWHYLVIDRDFLKYVEASVHPWIADPSVKRTDMRQLVVFSRVKVPGVDPEFSSDKVKPGGS